jgi:hypothetical protein
MLVIPVTDVNNKRRSIMKWLLKRTPSPYQHSFPDATFWEAARQIRNAFQSGELHRLEQRSSPDIPSGHLEQALETISFWIFVADQEGWTDVFPDLS